MKIVSIHKGKVHTIYPDLESVDAAYQKYSKSIRFVEAPDWVHSGFGFDETKTSDERFVKPLLSEGWEYDEDGNPYNPEMNRHSERESKHAATTNDTLQALRKLREGDTTIDWQAWLDQLDAYNVAIEETQNQEGYPQKVVYPEYPTKPAGAS